MLPATVVVPMFIVPVLLITVLPEISDVPVRVPLFMIGLVRVLLLRVSVAVSVTIVPDAGNTALELTPVPPLEVLSTPVTAAD